MTAQHNAKISTFKCYNQTHAINFSAFFNKFDKQCFLYLEKGRQTSLVSVFLLYYSFIQLPLNGWMAAATIPSLCIFTLIILAYYTPVTSLSCFALSLKYSVNGLINWLDNLNDLYTICSTLFQTHFMAKPKFPWWWAPTIVTDAHHYPTMLIGELYKSYHILMCAT